AVATLSMNQGLSSVPVASVLASRDGSVWLGTRSGLNRWNKGHISIPTTGSDKQDGRLINITALFQDVRGRIWVSSVDRTGYLENDRFTSITGAPGGFAHSI